MTCTMNSDVSNNLSSPVIIGNYGAYQCQTIITSRISTHEVARALRNNDEKVFGNIGRWDVYSWRWTGLGHQLQEPAKSFYYEQLESAQESL